MIKHLLDTKEMMCSSDYKERFKAEYYQLVFRYTKLDTMISCWNNLTFTPVCSRSLLKLQLITMWLYRKILEYRAKKENIEL